MLRISVDIGGTFTDLVVFNEVNGKCILNKASTTPQDQSIGALECLKKSKVDLTNTKSLLHGTTVIINTLLEGKGAKTGLITTKGFRDVYEIARMAKPEMYNPFYEKPRPLIPRHLILEVSERTNSDGKIVQVLDESEVEDCLSTFREKDVISIAVCLLNSYVNPDNEIKIGEIAKRRYPEAFVSLSHRVSNEWREYERTSTTAMNAYVQPIVGRYLGKLEAELQKAGLECGVNIMQSNGGLMTSEIAKAQPTQMIESGPVAGVIGAVFIGGLTGFKNIIAFDMGGTTAKSSLLENLEPQIKREFTVLGHPVRAPMIELEEVGAGGGSVGWIDPGGALHVGPRSAGADPGPVCYGKGGLEPTVTDANLLVGKINPEYFLGGEMKLNKRLANTAIRELGNHFGKKPIEMANDIIEIANSHMMGSIRLVSVQKGYDPREFSLVAYGGAGPLHACALAEELGIPNVIIPNNPAHFSAWGMLLADFRHDYVQVYVKETETADVSEINEVFANLEDKGRETLSKEDLETSPIVMLRSVDMRYVGQEHTVNVVASGGIWVENQKKLLENNFHSAHEKLFTFNLKSIPTEMVALRVTAIGKTKKPTLEKLERTRRTVENAMKGKRDVYFGQNDGIVECRIYERRLLSPGHELYGPCIVEEQASTTVLNADQKLTVDDYGHLVIQIA